MNRINEILVEKTTTKLSMAVNLIDKYSPGKVLGNILVTLKDDKSKPVKNPGGYYLFFNLTQNSNTVQVNGGDYYFDSEKKDVKLDELDPRDPVVNIDLDPSPSYPFPPSATLVRGFLHDSGNKGTPGVVINVRGKDIETVTTGKGEFALYFHDLKKDDVKTVDSRKLVKIKGRNPVLEIKHPDHRKRTRSVEVEEGKTTSLSITYP